MSRLVQVLAVEQRHELGMRDVIVPSELDQAPHAFYRSDVEQRQLLLGLADSRVRGFEHREEKPLLVSEVVVEHALVGSGCGGDPVYTRAAESVAGESVSQ